MSKEIDNEWGISDINDSSESVNDTNPKVDGQTRAFGGKMPVKEVTADLTNVISSQIIIDAVKNGNAEDDYVEDFSVDGELYAEDYTEEYINEGLEEALAEGNEEYYDEAGDGYEEEPEYYDEEEPIEDQPDDSIEDSIDESEYYEESAPSVSPKSKKHKDEIEEDNVEDEDGEDDEDKKDKLFLIGSIIVFVLIVILGIALLIKFHGGSSNSSNEEDTSIIDLFTPNDQSGTSDTITNTQDDSSSQSDANQTLEDDKKPDDSQPSKEQSACEKDGHKYKDATCTEPKTCTVCGKKDGNALGHDFQTADCTKPTTCSRCGQTGTDALGHNFADATCTEPKTCTRCEATEGEALGHDYEEATCEKPATCKRCGETKGEKAEHKYEEVSSTMTGENKSITYKCSVCGDTKTEDSKEEAAPLTGEQMAAKAMELVNAERASAGLPALTTTPELTKAANERAKEIATDFSHTRPDGRDAFTVLGDNGIIYTTCGENTAAGQKTPEEVVNSWMNSATHKANIMNASYTHMAIGYYNSGSGYTYYWVQMFTD